MHLPIWHLNGECWTVNTKLLLVINWQKTTYCLQNGDQCWCGDDFGETTDHPLVTSCDMQCDADVNYYCGGFLRNSIVRNDGKERAMLRGRRGYREFRGAGTCNVMLMWTITCITVGGSSGIPLYEMMVSKPIGVQKGSWGDARGVSDYYLAMSCDK